MKVKVIECIWIDIVFDDDDQLEGFVSWLIRQEIWNKSSGAGGVIRRYQYVGAFSKEDADKIQEYLKSKIKVK